MAPRYLPAAALAAFLGLRGTAQGPGSNPLDCIQRDMSLVFSEIQASVVALGNDQPVPSLAGLESRLETFRLLMQPARTPPLPDALQGLVQDLSRPLFDGIGRAAESLGSPDGAAEVRLPDVQALPEALAPPEDGDLLPLPDEDELFNEREARKVVGMMYRGPARPLASWNRASGLRPMRLSGFGSARLSAAGISPTPISFP